MTDHQELRIVSPETDVTGMWGEYRERMIPHTTLTLSLELAAEFSEDESVLKGEYMAQQFEDFTHAVRSIPGYKGSFATGYPYYAQNPDGGVYAVPEIARYARSFIPKIEADAARGNGAWICGACQVFSDLPDLKSQCKPCDAVDIRPRDIFKALPDVDFWVVADDDETPVSEFEQAVEDHVEREGFYVSDKDIAQAFDDTIHVMKALKRGNMPPTRLPLDLHVVTKKQMLNRLGKVQKTLKRGEMLPISTRSLHKQWESSDEPYDFLKDFLFSMTPGDWPDAELQTALFTSRKAAKEHIGSKIVEIVSGMAEKEARQLGATPLQECLVQRIRSW
jgi:hypothetical protein